MNSQKSVKRGSDGADFLHTDKIGHFNKKELKIASLSEALFMVKRGVKVWNNQVFAFFSSFYYGNTGKLKELESESKIFMQKLTNLYWPLSMGPNQ